MTLQEIYDYAEKLRREQLEEPEPSMNNYRQVLGDYKRFLNDATVLIRELANWAMKQEGVKQPEGEV